MKTQLRRYSIILLLAWTLLNVGLGLWNANQSHDIMQEMALKEARANFIKDWAFRRWATTHGGVYVPITETTSPNPYLSHIPERDIETPSGVELTLMNPAYMVRQLNEFFFAEYGVAGHLTSLNPLNPRNAPDEWETDALLQFETGVEEVYEFVDISNEPHLRLMKPLITEEGCLKCHEFQGYEVGDIRGGIGVALPIEDYLTNYSKELRSNVISLGTLWLLGFVGIIFGVSRLELFFHKYEEANLELAKSEKRFQTVMNSMDDVVFTLDTQQRHTEVYGRWVEKAGMTSDMFLGKTAAEIMGPDAAKVHEEANVKALKGKNITYNWSTGEGESTQYFQTSLSPIYNGDKVTGIVGVGRDVTREKRIQKRLVQGEKRYHSLITAMAEGIVFQAADGAIITCNPSAERILGLTQDQMMGKTSVDPSWRAIHEDGSPFPGETHPAMVTLSTGKPQYGVIMGVHKPSGELTWISINSQPLFNNGEEKPYAVVTSFNDITKIREAQQHEINLTLERERTQILTNFIQDASHEFRTPLSIIQTSLHLLKSHDDPEKRTKQVEKIRMQSDNILQLVDDLLVMARLDANPEPELQEINSKQLFDGIMESNVKQANKKQQQIKMHIEELTLHGDYNMLSMALSQLVKNAIKYTPEGGTISIQVERNDPCICTFIHDGGPGIPDDNLPHIFERFYRGDKSRTTPGSGLGLSIVAKVVELHQGRISVKSSSDGSTFSVCLPISRE